MEMRDDELGALDDDDDRLIRREEYARLLARYKPLVEQRVRVRVRGASADDVVQLVLVALWRRLSSGKPLSARFRHVVHRRIDFAIKDFYAEGRPFEHDVDDLELEGTSGVEIDDWAYLRSLLESLPPGARDVARLWMAGLDPQQIARHLRMKRNAVDQALFRIRKTLREILNG